MAKVSSAKKSHAHKSNHSNKSNKSNHSNKSHKSDNKSKTQPKSADINSKNASQRAKNINDSGEINDGKFKSRSDATVGDVAQANVMDENGNVQPDEVKQQVQDIVTDNKQLADKAKELGIDLENPTDEDLQKLADLDIKAGQEIDVPEKEQKAEDVPAEEATGEEVPEEAAEEASGSGGGGSPSGAGEDSEGCSGPGSASGADQAKDKNSAENILAQIMEMISSAEKAQDPYIRQVLAQQAIQAIDQLRSQLGVQKGQGENKTQPNNTNNTNNQLVNKIKSGANLDSNTTQSIQNVLKSSDTNTIASVLDALEQRAVAAKNGNSNSLNALNLQGQQNNSFQKASNNLNSLLSDLKIPYLNSL